MLTSSRRNWKPLDVMRILRSEAVLRAQRGQGQSADERVEGEGSEDARRQHEAALGEEAEHLVARPFGARLGPDHEVLDRLLGR